ncbi:ATP-binding cassette domain-containing protein [Leptospira fluminis]|uniref:ATP-binding cassette domain-containing protein n=1 Tax=Leptospira fluminis TaxID=2484979 RepID=A0A4R9GMJ7_9LEPT|nr:ATP-binding cassette domain-containing protein [Leptospira fluminis]TGK17468.1 ATP-binding cassette domain-containing protein [Leptospira fluminis]
MSALQAVGLSKSFSDKQALLNLSFSIPKGRITALLGPNGAGKTTTMRILTGFLEPDSGSISFGPLSLSENPIEVKRNLGYLPESAPLYGDLTAEETLEFIGQARGLKGEVLRRRIREMREVCDLGDHFFATIQSLSKGFRQRVALAGTLLHDPEYVILDEPSSGLDPNQIGQIRSIIRSLGKDKVVVLSTHILQEAQEICDHVLILNRGRMIADTSVSEMNRQDSVLVIAKTDLQAVRNCFLGTDVDIREESRLADTGTFRLKSSNWSPESLFDKIRNADFPVLEFRPVRKSLETVFRELTAPL